MGKWEKGLIWIELNWIKYIAYVSRETLRWESRGQKIRDNG